MDVQMKFAWVPPGSYLMGSKLLEDNPPHRVSVSKGFWMGIFPVTQGQFRAVMGYNPSKNPVEEHPADTVSWDDAQEFCKSMSELTGKQVRLPTEEEWEYACRAGTGTKFCNGNDNYGLSEVGWFNGDESESDPADFDLSPIGPVPHTIGSKPVGGFAPNTWGLFDMHGNVWEWCTDIYQPIVAAVERPDELPPPVRPSRDRGRARNDRIMVIRGGSFREPAEKCAAPYRGHVDSNTREDDIGFRVCFSADRTNPPTGPRRR